MKRHLRTVQRQEYARWRERTFECIMETEDPIKLANLVRKASGSTGSEVQSIIVDDKYTGPEEVR